MFSRGNSLLVDESNRSLAPRLVGAPEAGAV